MVTTLHAIIPAPLPGIGAEINCSSMLILALARTSECSSTAFGLTWHYLWNMAALHSIYGSASFQHSRRNVALLPLECGIRAFHFCRRNVAG